MKKIYYIAVVFAILFLAGCGDGIDLPGVNVETDLNKIPLPDNNVNLVWGIERSGFFNGQGKWAKGFENQMV